MHSVNQCGEREDSLSERRQWLGLQQSLRQRKVTPWNKEQRPAGKVTVSRSHAILYDFRIYFLTTSDRPTAQNKSPFNNLSAAESRCGCLKDEDTVESVSGSFLIDVPPY